MPTTLSTLADGAVEERFEIELQKVFDNIIDPNTSHKAKRELIIKLTFETDENRQISNVVIDTKANLAPAKGIATMFLMDRDSSGNAIGAEFAQGRLFDDSTSSAESSSTDSGKVSYLEQKQSGRA